MPGGETLFVHFLGTMQSRKRSDNTPTTESLKARDKREESFGLAAAMELAGLRVVNESTKDAYETVVRRMLLEEL